MAAYAALVSLLNTVDEIKSLSQNIEFYKAWRGCRSFVYDTEQVESLAEKICFLLDFIEAADHSRGRGGRRSSEADRLEAKITSAAYEAEDEIESRLLHLVDDDICISDEDSVMISLFDLQTLLGEMDCIQEEVNKFKQGNNESKTTHLTISSISQITTRDEKVGCSVDAASSTPPMSTTMIGFGDQLNQLMEMLVGWESSRKIIVVHGMGGIGKTTLARNTFQHKTIVDHFHMQAWATVSQTYTTEAVLEDILKSCQSRSSDYKDEQSSEKLHKILSGRRYLIILDDVWSVEALENIMLFCPNNNNGSRIVVTTRLSNMATYFGKSYNLSMNLLDEEESWNLLREKTFGKQVIPPPELVEIGKHIATECKGLPLSITVIGRLLGKSTMTQEYWMDVAEDISSILNSGDEEHCLNILSLSYIHMPVHLKPCFLYMGVSPEDHAISVSRMIKLWVAEGFLKPNESRSPEESAESHILELVERNLILPLKWDIVSGKLKSFIMHDLLRDLCLRIGEKENFLRVINRYASINRKDLARDRRLVLNDSRGVDLNSLQSASLARSVFHDKWLSARFKFNVLRVLDCERGADHLTKVISKTFHMRYLAFTGNPDYSEYNCPSMWPTEWTNLQTLICREGKFFFKLRIWDRMPQLRHVVCRVIRLPDPARNPEYGFFLPNLQTLKTVKNMRLSEELCRRRIPNVRSLGLRYSAKFKGGYDCLGYLFQLDKLQKLRLECWTAHNDLLANLKLPSSIQKLTLRGLELVGWEDLGVIGSLPNLQVLRLEHFSGDGYEWSSIEGQFPALKYLRIVYCGRLARWNADSFHFPVLEKLHLQDLSELVEIPLGIGDIPTLRLIRVVVCSVACAISALNILEEQESQGNEGLRVRIQFLTEQEKHMETLVEKVGSLRSNHLNNVRLEYC